MSKNKEDDELMKKILDEYFPIECRSNDHDILILRNLNRIHKEETRCYSLEHKGVYQGWKKFLDDLPESKDEIIPSVEERYWRWKMYKKYVVEDPYSEEEDRKRFVRSMRSTGLDKFGHRYPINYEDLNQFRPNKGYQFKIKRK